MEFHRLVAVETQEFHDRAILTPARVAGAAAPKTVLGPGGRQSDRQARHAALLEAMVAWVGPPATSRCSSVAEQLIRNQQVVGSRPSAGSIQNHQLTSP